MATKRNRQNGQLSREEYDQEEEQTFEPPGTFLKASSDVLSTRRILTSQGEKRVHEFVRHIEALNKSFSSWYRSEIKKNPSADLSNGVKDYVDYVTQLEERYMRTYGQVLTFGTGDCGQLGHGIEDDDDLCVVSPRIVQSLRNKKVLGIACGGLHNVVYTESGQVYSWGSSDDGALGRVGLESAPGLVEGGLQGEIVIGVACGDIQSLSLTVKGEVFGWGAYRDKEGVKWFPPSEHAPEPHLDIEKVQVSPIRIQGLANIVEVACGSGFNLARGAEGALYSWGTGEVGQLGRTVCPLTKDQASLPGGKERWLKEVLRTHLTPGPMFRSAEDEAKYFSSLKANSSADPLSLPGRVGHAKALGCGEYFSLVVCVDEDKPQGNFVLGCGLNNYGQLGLGTLGNQSFLQEIEALSGMGIRSVKGGSHFSLVLTSEGRVLAVGRADDGKLGSKEHQSAKSGESSMTFVDVALPPGVVIGSIACGGSHSLALTLPAPGETPSLFSWGYGDNAALGHGEEHDELLPRKLDFGSQANVRIVEVAAGSQHSAIVGHVRE